MVFQRSESHEVSSADRDKSGEPSELRCAAEGAIHRRLGGGGSTSVCVRAASKPT